VARARRSQRASRAKTDLEDADIFLDEARAPEEAGEVDLAALEDKIDRRLLRAA